MKAWIISLWLVGAISLVPSSGFGQPVAFFDTDDLFITQIGNDQYMVMGDVSFDRTFLWAAWKFNNANGNWELFTLGEPAPGENTASGKYAYDTSKDILIWKINYSLFLGCAGPDAGTSVFSAAISEPILRLTLIDVDNEDGNDTMELTRVSGSPGQIQGQWSATVESNSYLFSFNAGGAMSVSGNVQDCLND